MAAGEGGSGREEGNAADGRRAGRRRSRRIDRSNYLAKSVTGEPIRARGSPKISASRNAAGWPHLIDFVNATRRRFADARIGSTLAESALTIDGPSYIQYHYRAGPAV